MASTWLPPWFDGFFLSMLATSVIVVSVNWERYNRCTFPLHIWIVVDYASVFIFRVLMFVNNGLAARMGPEISDGDRLLRFKGRILITSCLTFVLYPFLWAWTVIGSLWFSDAKTCLPEEGQKWGFLIWLIFSYCGLTCIACISVGQWQLRRQAHLHLVSSGSAAPASEFEILFELVRVPDWAFVSVQPGHDRNSGQGGGHDLIAYHPGLYLTQAQREEVEKLIQELPTFRLKAVPLDTSGCPICLEEFEIGTEVRGLPCAHNFHVPCIDEWLKLNVKCPHCRCSVFPQFDFSAAFPSQAQAQRQGQAQGQAQTQPQPQPQPQVPTAVTRGNVGVNVRQGVGQNPVLGEDSFSHGTNNSPRGERSLRSDEEREARGNLADSVVITVNGAPPRGEP